MQGGCTDGAIFARVSFPDQPVQISCRVVIALICALYVAVGASLMVPEIILSPCRIRYSGVMLGYVMNLLRNSTVSETLVGQWVNRSLSIYIEELLDVGNE